MNVCMYMAVPPIITKSKPGSAQTDIILNCLIYSLSKPFSIVCLSTIAVSHSTSFKCFPVASNIIENPKHTE